MMTDTISSRDLRRALSIYSQRSTAIGLTLFLVDYITFIVMIVIVLFTSIWYVQLIAAILAGVKMANLTTLAHDAAHNSLTESRTLNKVLGIFGFMPGLFNYALWLYDHHNLHHRNTNEEHPDSYVPISKKTFDGLSRWNKFKYKLYRLPSIWFFGLYYIVERWWQAKFFPRKRMPLHVRRRAWFHFVILLVYLTGFGTLLILAPLYTSNTSFSALLYGFIIPFYVFQTLYAFTVYVQHNHYRVPWFQNKSARLQEEGGEQAYISVTLKFPNWLSRMVHNVYDHAPHHVCPSIPSYKLPEAQAKLEELLGEKAVVSKFSFRWLYNTMRRCKLYDFESHRWINYDGIPTTRNTLHSTEDNSFQPVDNERRKLTPVQAT